MPNLNLDIDKLIEDLTRAKPSSRIIKKKVVKPAPSVYPEVGLSEKFRLLTRDLKPESRRTYCSCINRFLRFIKEKESPDAWDLRRFFDDLDKEGISRSYQRVAWQALKIFFEAKGFEWPLTKRDRPKLDRSVIKKPTLSEDEIARMIRAVRADKDPLEMVLIALGSVYALRKSEFCSLIEKNIDRQNHTLFIQTKKRGEPRHHLIPEEIRPFVYPWNFEERVSSSKIHIIFNAILAKAGVKKRPGLNTHALRRGVFTALCSTDLPPMRVYDFGGWKKKEMGMLAEYDNPDFRERDRLVFSKHPFLGRWRK